MPDEAHRAPPGADPGTAAIAIARLFDRLNIDLTSRDDLRELCQDLEFLRRQREAGEERAMRRRTAIWTSAGAAVVSAMGVLLTWLFQQGRNL